MVSKECDFEGGRITFLVLKGRMVEEYLIDGNVQGGFEARSLRVLWLFVRLCLLVILLLNGALPRVVGSAIQHWNFGFDVATI